METSVSAVRQRAGRVLHDNGERIARLFRQETTAWLQKGQWLSPLLDGVIEPFLARLGEELLSQRPDPSAPWTRAGGVLRLSRARGPEAVHREIECLRSILRDAVGALGGSGADAEEVLDICNAAVAVLHDGILDEQARLEGRRQLLGAPRFGGVVLELFEESAVVRHVLPGGRHQPAFA